VGKLYGCQTCGSAVMDRGLHTTWHQQMDDVDLVATEALRKADDALNTLYQNNIQS
jgi:hypothetical protein